MTHLTQYPLTRATHVLTAGYGLFALVKPGHLQNGLEDQAGDKLGTDRLARTYTGRELPVTLLGILGPASLVPTTVALRVANDLTDAAVLGSTTTGKVRTRILGITLGWAALNAAAFALDTRRR